MLRSLRSQLLTLAMVVLIPASVFSGLLLVLLWQQQQREIQDALSQAARAVTVAVDREIQSSISRLRLLSSTETLMREDWAQFDREAGRQVEVAQDWTNLILLDAGGRVLVNVAPSPGKPSELRSLAYLQEIAATGEPVVSDIFKNPANGAWTIHVGIPVVRERVLRHVLVASLNVSGFDEILAEQAPREGAIAGILDRQLRFVARSQGAERLRGKPPTPEMLRGISGSRRGTGELMTHERISVYGSWDRSITSGWTVVVGLPAQPIQQSLRRSLLMLGAIGAAVLVLAGGIAHLLQRSIVRGIVAVGEDARALARGAELPRRTSRTAEIHGLMTALRDAQQLLRTESDEREKAERERAQLLGREQAARTEAETANRAKDEFLAMLGHELRNPLAPIVTAIELMKIRGNVPTTREIGIIERQARHLTQLVNDLLDVSRIVRGNVPLKKERLELRPVIMRAVEMAGPLLENKKHSLEVEVAEEGLPIWGDATRLAQVFANLLTNAAKFTPPSGHIRVKAHRERDELVVSVRDDGVGISPSLLPNVFESFTQGHITPDRAQGGLGLGLAIVRSFVERHGGSVRAHSEGEGTGAEFTVRLPVLAVQPDPAPTQRTKAEALARAKVLVVDDNPDAAAMVGEIIANAGYEVRVSYDPTQALAEADRFEPDVALLDIGLPAMDGYELGSALLARFPKLRLVAITGYGLEQDRNRSAEVGFAAHLVKPVRAEQVLDAVASS